MLTRSFNHRSLYRHHDKEFLHLLVVRHHDKDFDYDNTMIRDLATASKYINCYIKY